MSGSPEVVVVGGAAMDWVAQVNTLPNRDELVLARSFGRFPGGSAANTAVGIARLGRQVGFVGKLGDDEPGDQLRQAFVEAGVDTTHLVVEAGRPTATCFIAVDRRGERVIVALPGISLIERADELDPAYWRSSRVLYLGPCYPEVALAAAGAVEGLRGAPQEPGATLALHWPCTGPAASTGGQHGRPARAAVPLLVFAPGSGWDPAGLELLRPALAQVDVLLLSQREALSLTGRRSPAEALDQMRALDVPLVVMTRGVRGATLLEAGRLTEIPACPAHRLRDTTGAGDAFAAGLVVGFLEGRSWKQAAWMGCAVAALAMGQLGARNGLPTRQAVQQAMSLLARRPAPPGTDTESYLA